MKRAIDINISEFILKELKTYKDWPKAGVNFLNTVELCKDPASFFYSVEWYNHLAEDYNCSALFAVDARGFLWASPVAYNKRLPLHVVRKKGKMPGDLVSKEYQLEYGADTLQLAKINKPEGKVLIVDDVLATGGTVGAVCKLLHEEIGVKYEDIIVATLLNITFLGGEEKIKALGAEVINLIDVN